MRAEPEHRRAVRRGRRRLEQRDRRSCREVQDVSDDMEMKSPRVEPRDRPRQGGRRRPERDAGRERALRRLRAEVVVDDLRPDAAQYRVLLELDPKYQEHADSLKKIAFKTPTGALVPLESVVELQGDGRPAVDQPLGPAAGGVDLVRPPAGRLARRGDRRTSSSVADGLLPPTVTTSFQGSAKVFQAVDGEPRPAALRRHRRRLHRARRCCTRATSTRSRFSRGCRRPASARSSRCGCSATS